MSSNPTVKLNAPDHTIKSVTIFKSSKAEIVRHFSLELKAGQTKVEIIGLSSSIDTHSVRVSGLGEARLYDVVCTLDASKDTSYAPDSASEIIRLLKVKKHALESEKRVREHEADLLVNYAKTLSGEHVPPAQMSAFLESFVQQGRKNLEDISELGEKIIALDRDIERETEKSISKKGNARGEVSIVLGSDDASVIDLKLTYIVSNVSWKPTYELHATTENGKPSPSVTLHYRARVVQSTGEDWSSTSLTLSTMSSDTIAKRIPRLLPVKLRPRTFAPGRLFGDPQNATQQQQQQQQQQAPRQGGFLNVPANPSLKLGPGLFGNGQLQTQVGGPGASNTVGGTGLFGQSAHPAPGFNGTSLFSQQASVPAFGFSAFSASAPQPTTFGGFGSGQATQPAEEEFEDISSPETITEPTTFVYETPVAISFSITGESTIPSDGIEHQVSVAILPFEAKISYVAIPRIEPRVYLQCAVKNGSEYRLLAGPVSVILDDSYVSKTSISDVGTGEYFDCTLGDDAATKVTYSRTARTSKTDAGAFSEAQNVTTYTTMITIYNKHGFPLSDLVVREAVPTVDDKRARVILRKPEGLADAKDGEVVMVRKEGEDPVKVAWELFNGEKEGKFAWRANIKAKDKVVLESQWELKAPTDTQWHEGMAD